MKSKKMGLLGRRDLEAAGRKIISPVIFLRVSGFLFTNCFLFRDVRCNWTVVGREKLLLGIQCLEERE